MTNIIDNINSVLWSMPVIVFVLFAGVFFTAKNRFYQFTHFKSVLKKTIFSSLKNKEDKAKFKEEFRSMTLVLASCIGTGNMAGVASAIMTGGAGAVFWMWLSACFGMMTSYTENVFGFRSRVMKNGAYHGGAMYYLRDGIKNEKMSAAISVVFGILCSLSSLLMGNAVQVGTISASFKDAFGIPAIVTGLILAVIMLAVFLGGGKKLVAFTGSLIPAASVFYFIATAAVIIANYKKIPDAFGSIFAGAFGINSIVGGINGTIVKNAINSGLRRGVFSNESGLGVSPIAHAGADMKNEDVQGNWGIFEVFFDTIVLCSLTAFAVLCSGVPITQGDSSVLINSVFSSIFGKLGSSTVSIAIFLFAFSTLAGWSYYGEQAFEYVFGKRKGIVFKIIYLVCVPLFAFIKADLLWSLADTVNAAMMLINLSALLWLSRKSKHSVRTA